MRSNRRGRGGSDRPEPPELGELVARVTEEDVGPAERRRRLAILARAVSGSVRSAGLRALAGGRWMTDVVTDVAPRIPIRDAATLRSHHPGRGDGQIAASLARSATLATAAVGGAAGALAAVEFAAPPLLLAAPAQIAAETLAVVAIEVKLVAELHELHGLAPPGVPGVRAAAYLTSWTRQRALDPLLVANVGAVLGQAAKRELRSRIAGRLGRSATSLAPLLAGALAGSEVNRRATRRLGDTLIAELRGRMRSPGRQLAS